MKNYSLTLVICTEDQNTDKQGIHLRSPDSWYLRDAFMTADRDGFNTIYCHYKTDGLQYKLSEDALNQLFELAVDMSVRVHIEHPASPQTFIDNKSKQVKRSA